MPINDLLSRFLNSRGGAVLVFVALGMTVFIGFAALSRNWSHKRRAGLDPAVVDRVAKEA